MSGVGATGAPIVSFSGATDNNVPDWTFFDISNASAGETFTVTGYGGPNGCACIGVIAFDSGIAPQSDGVPEPASLTLFGAGLAGLAWMRRLKLTGDL